MALFGGGYAGPREVKYLFVDAGCLNSVLRRASERYFDGLEIPLDFAALSREFTKAFYYDAWPTQKPSQSDEEFTTLVETHQRRVELIAGTDGWHVYEGETVHRGRKRGLEQKKVDVMIAVDMLRHTFRGNMHRATLLTSDLDFKPLLDALVSEGMNVTLWYPPDETSGQLARAADARRHLNVGNIRTFIQKDFLTARPLPDASIGPFEGDRLVQLCVGLDQDSTQIAIWRDLSDNRLVLTKAVHGVVSPPPTEPYMLHVRHESWQTLKRWSEEVHNIRLAADFPSPAN